MAEQSGPDLCQKRDRCVEQANWHELAASRWLLDSLTMFLLPVTFPQLTSGGCFAQHCQIVPLIRTCLQPCLSFPAKSKI